MAAESSVPRPRRGRFWRPSLRAGAGRAASWLHAAASSTPLWSRWLLLVLLIRRSSPIWRTLRMVLRSKLAEQLVGTRVNSQGFGPKMCVDPCSERGVLRCGNDDGCALQEPIKLSEQECRQLIDARLQASWQVGSVGEFLGNLVAGFSCDDCDRDGWLDAVPLSKPNVAVRRT